jgi:hypothetical protein
MKMSRCARILLFIPCLTVVTYALDRSVVQNLSGASLVNNNMMDAGVMKETM